MPLKTKICRLCGASFVPNYKNQQYCNECYKIHTRHSKINSKHSFMCRKSKKNEK